MHKEKKKPGGSPSPTGGDSGGAGAPPDLNDFRLGGRATAGEAAGKTSKDTMTTTPPTTY